MRQPFGGGADPRVPGFLSPFDCRRSLLGSSCARWGGSAFLTVGLPAVDPPDPNGVVMLRMNKIRPGRAPPLPRGRWCAPGRQLSLRPAPAASRAASPYGPADTSHRRGSPSRGVIGGSLRSPITPRWLAATPEPESETASRRSSPRPRPPDGTAAASASTPGFAPRGHPRSTPGRRQALRALARVLHLRHQSNLQTVPPTSLMHPHVAPSRRWLPAPPRDRRRPARAAVPARPDR